MNARYLKVAESLQYGDMYHNITVVSNDDVGKLAKIQYTFMRPIALDMEGGKYRLLEKQDHSRADIEYWNDALGDWFAYVGSFTQGVIYRVPVTPEPVQEVKEADRQCTCKVTPSGIHGTMFLFPQKKCPVKAHSDYSQLQGSKRDLGDITKAKPPFMIPTVHECYNNLVNNYDQEGFAGSTENDEFAIDKTLDFINARYGEYLSK